MPMDGENSLWVLFVVRGSKRVGATTFSTVSRARLRHATAGPESGSTRR